MGRPASDMFQHRLQFPPAIAGRSALELWVGFCGAYLLYWAFRAIYRIYWHPLARYPGSALAAASTEWCVFVPFTPGTSSFATALELCTGQRLLAETATDNFRTRYEWYWNMYQPGALLFEIERLHKQHGMQGGTNGLSDTAYGS